MRSRLIDPSRAVLVAVLLGAGALSACIIGPKQDDPEPSLKVGEGDTGVSFDAGGGGPQDTDANDKLDDATVTDTGTSASVDAAPPPADACGDGDACVPDGGADGASDAPDAATDASDGAGDVLGGD